MITEKKGSAKGINIIPAAIKPSLTLVLDQKKKIPATKNKARNDEREPVAKIKEIIISAPIHINGLRKKE